jgi:hypothetical protein|tara:strand:- start:249 stop:515 length:267 start_codon:yes stop_codon:yes gene_type:complete
MDNNNMKHISTNNLTAVIYSDGDIKLQIYNTTKSPYGWSPKKLIVSLFSVKAKEFTFDYVKSQVDKVYSTFPNEEIHNFITKIKQYYE